MTPIFDPELFEIICNNSNAGIIYYSILRNEKGEIIDFRYEFINNTAHKIFKHITPDFIGTTLRSHYTTKQLKWLNSYKKVAETGVQLEEHSSTEIGGSLKYFMNKMVKYKDGIILYFYDETEKAKLAQELEEKNNDLKKLLDAKDGLMSEVLNKALDGVLYMKPIFNESNEIIDFKNVFANESGLKFLNTDPEFYYSHTFLETFPASVENGSLEEYKSNYLNNTFHSKLYRYDVDNNEAWFMVESFKYDNGVIIFFRDETNSKQYEQRIEKQNKELNSLLKQKEILLQETHHRIKNNLQVIASLLSLKSRTIDDIKAVEAFEDSIKRIRTISIIHEKLYRNSNDYETLGFEGFINDVVSAIRNFYNSGKEIKFNYNVEDVNLPISNCINIGLILNELISNSIKHAFAKNDECVITIESKVQDNKLKMLIADNGSGISKDIDLNNLSSLGLSIVPVLVEQMEGTLSIKNNNGTCFHITLPLY